MKLFNQYILVEKEEEKQQEGGLAKVSAVTKVLGKGKVTHICEGSFVNVGDTVYFEKTLGTEFEIDGKQVKFVKLEDIMATE